DGEAQRRSDVEYQQRISLLEKEAFAQGYREGERIGKQSGQRMMETSVKRYDQMLAELAKAHLSVVAAMERKTVELALDIARKVIQREIALDRDIVNALAIVALARVQSHASITLRVGREDYPRVREAIAGINNAITVVDDGSLERGDFLIDTSQTHLDGRIGN